MVIPIILASGSSVRAQMLRNAHVEFDVIVPQLDEDTPKQAMLAQNTPPHDIADILADKKALKIGKRNPDAYVIGCDQVLEFNGRLISKPTSQQQALDQLGQMRGQMHNLFSAAVIYQGHQPVWRHIGQARMTMRMVSDEYLTSYVSRNWEDIRHCAGAYMIEAEGLRLFESIDGDYFSVLGMPLLEILNFLALRGVIAK